MSKSNKTEVEHYDNLNSLTTANLHLPQSTVNHLMTVDDASYDEWIMI